MQAAADATPSGMASILGLEPAAVEQLCTEARSAGRIWIANLLGPGNIVVSGERAALDAITPLAEAAGATKVIKLAVAGAFHTDIMRPADQQLAAVLDSVEIRAPRMPVISNVDAAPHAEPADIRQVLLCQVLAPVLWEDSMRRLLADGCDAFYEIGPGRVLKGLMRRIDRKAACESVLA